MTMQDYQRLVVTYKSPFTAIDPAVRADIDLLLETVLAQASATTKMKAIIEEKDRQLAGSRVTMTALTRALGGTIEIPFALIDDLHPQDRLLISDVETPHGPMKRFAFRAFDPDAVPAPAPAPPPDPPRLHLVQ